MTDYTERVNALREHADLIETSIELYGPSATRLLVYDLRNAAAAIEELWADNNILHQHIEDMNEAFRDKSVECQQAAKRNAELHAELERWVSAAEQAAQISG